MVLILLNWENTKHFGKLLLAQARLGLSGCSGCCDTDAGFLLVSVQGDHNA